MTCAVGLATAASASANEVVLEAGAKHAAPNAAVNVSLPPDVTLKALLLSRSVTGLGNEGALGTYAATFKWNTVAGGVTTPHNAVLESSNKDTTGDVALDAPDNPGNDRSVLLGISGPQDAAADFSRVGLRVDDATDPTAAVGGIGSDVTGDMNVAVWANDVGIGLWKAELWVDGALVGSVPYIDEINGNAGADCVARADAGSLSLPLVNDCLKNGQESIKVASSQFGDGNHKLTVRLFDFSGRVNEVVKDYAFKVLNFPDPGNKSADLKIGSGNTTQQNGSGSNGNGSGGVAGASSTSCNSPRLSMELSQKPLKVSKGVPVLVSGRRYRFRGKLTCIVNGKRRSAEVKTPVELLNTIGKHTYRKGGATVRTNGAITLILSYKSSRTLVFRYTNPDGRRSQVKLKIKVVKSSR